MVESVPAPLQVVLWPLVGAMLILALHRLLPNWLRRMVALVAVLASILALWSLRSGGAAVVTLHWQPLNLFRTGPILEPTGLALFAGVVAAAVTAALVLGIEGSARQDTHWHGCILLALAGVLLVALAGNLLTLSLGSGLVDLSLIALAISASDGKGRVTWRMVVPGVASTLLFLASAVQMDAGLGTTSLSARDFPLENLLLLGIAGTLRLLVFPFHARQIDSAEDAGTLLLPVGAGIYVLARVQTIGAALGSRSWMVALGGLALFAGGLMTWAGSTRKTDMAGSWSGIAIHQTGLALVYVLLLRPPVPWPWLGLALALGLLAIRWAETEATTEPALPGWAAQIAARAQPLQERAKAAVAARMPALRRWRGSSLGWPSAALFPAVALLSLAGLPCTAGAIARWPLYATLLTDGKGGMLIIAMAGDTMLAAGLWTLVRRELGSGASGQPKPGSLLSMLLLAISLIASGLVSGRLASGLGVRPPVVPGVSVWGLGFVFVLPWLFGAWLSQAGRRFGRSLHSIDDLVRLDWLYQAAGQVARAMGGAAYWVSNVGEGEGWWGWALIVLAIGALFFTLH